MPTWGEFKRKQKVPLSSTNSFCVCVDLRLCVMWWDQQEAAETPPLHLSQWSQHHYRHHRGTVPYLLWQLIQWQPLLLDTHINTQRSQTCSGSPCSFLLTETALLHLCGGSLMIGRVVILYIRSSVMFNVSAQIMRQYVTSELLQRSDQVRRGQPSLSVSCVVSTHTHTHSNTCMCIHQHTLVLPLHWKSPTNHMPLICEPSWFSHTGS